ncbi:NUDIX domain-containing protein [Halomicroarcula limicola]|uniref:NUDIX domain-containing protein n=1 Tax=Haloarcula limicola TaxID=1429915 RepID=A0A8J7YCF9_9EURY|nr:NUDIX domain-containing protein [Halomicroarcula limicola]MBV0923948.1 NUDIX domain-containing protein [Halomicroarcula limicola]
MNEQFLEATVSVRGVVCTPDEQILTVRRASDGGWELPGGRMNRGEDVTDCLRREIDEETALSVTVHRPVHVVSWQNDTDDSRLAVYYHCTAASAEVTLSEEHTDSAWVSETAARERLSDPQVTALERALDANAKPAVGDD